MDTGFEVERLRRAGQPIQVAQTYFEQKGFGIGPDNSGPVQYADAAGEEEDSSTAVSYASLPSAPPQPARVTPARH